MHDGYQRRVDGLNNSTTLICGGSAILGSLYQRWAMRICVMGWLFFEGVFPIFLLFILYFMHIEFLSSMDRKAGKILHHLTQFEVYTTTAGGHILPYRMALGESCFGVVSVS
jgi:hypothetical protein